MATYCVNLITEDFPKWGSGYKSDQYHDCVGLFTKPEDLIQTGNFCGYFSYEAYKNTTLIAFYQAKDLDPASQCGPIYRINRHFPKIEIWSIYANRVIEAKDDEEAIEKFKKHEWVHAPVSFSEGEENQCV